MRARRAVAVMQVTWAGSVHRCVRLCVLMLMRALGCMRLLARVPVRMNVQGAVGVAMRVFVTRRNGGITYP